MRYLLTLIFSISFGLNFTFGQFERFKTFDVADGICHPFVYTINQDKNGFIWLGTGEGLCRFDGFNFESFTHFDSLSNDVVSTSYLDSNGKLWFGFSNGLILSWNGILAKKYILPIESNSGISSITQTPQGDIFVATQSRGCFLIDSEGRTRLLDESLAGKFISSAFFSKDYLLLGTNEGLEIIPFSDKGFDFSRARLPEELSYINVQVIRKTNWPDKYLIGTEDAGLFLLSFVADSFKLLQIGADTKLASQNVQDLLLFKDNNLWVSTYYGGLIKITGFKEDGSFSSLNQFTKKEGFSTNYIKTLFSDREENLWIGTYGNGVNLLTEQSFSFMSFEDQLAGNNILSVASNDSLLWIGGENGLLEVDLKDKKNNRFYTASVQLPKDVVTALFHMNNFTWIGTDKNGIYQLDSKRKTIIPFFRTNNSLGNSINSLFAMGSNLYAATKDGIYSFDLISGKVLHYNTTQGLPHNDIEFIYLDNENRLLFATRSNGIFELTEKGEIVEYFSVEKYELEFNSITRDVTNQLWVSTYGQGVFLLKSDTVLNFTANSGLKSNYCYSISTGDSNFIWVGHRMGLSRIDIHNYSIKTFDISIGITGDCNLNAVASNKAGKMFFGTTDGLLIYDAHKGKRKSVPPKTNILRLVINDTEYAIDKPIVLPYSPYKLRIEFVGLNYNDPKAVRYQYKLEGYDMEWSEISDLRFAIYSRVDDGEFEFKLRSFGHDGQFEAEPVSFFLTVKPPVWKTWWFITLMVIVTVLLIIFIIKYRERQQKELQEYLEKSLDERTREVVEQKEEIEVKNRDITDSINYAQRIQNSILPPIKKLQQYFSGSFIFYQPRDIVSGDFYWFEKITDSKLIVVCADSTGHGVPGAFMSMIGTTLIKDICLSQKITSPEGMLKELDNQLASTLNQNVDELKSNDGMDVMVCEIDINTRLLRYASAMRPMIVYKDGEQLYIKGSRSSIGGQYDNKEEKDFEGGELQLNKGDLVYMFSDGFPDQFGGSMGKKFKMVRLKNLLKDIHKKPMEEQYEYIRSTFNLWKEDYEQVDDVLFMGIKI